MVVVQLHTFNDLPIPSFREFRHFDRTKRRELARYRGNFHPYTRFFGSSVLSDFAPFNDSFLSDRKSRHFDRTEQRELGASWAPWSPINFAHSTTLPSCLDRKSHMIIRDSRRELS
ncbi:hypothetical protein MA16_Dca014863 [Dendrobium catenatum]|uniref:Uncharacterized protein n=1 Tax=Dendrobium catenatum TaxID=906689 RepID=A0A2I0V6U0_9ASPA|nr:hypothetical protein MA16_Dca014863 [Dendrobium catenatum]